MKRCLAALVMCAALIAAGCGGGTSDTSTQTYADPTESWDTTSEATDSGYYNVDGSPPYCVTLATNGQQGCNTDEEVVLAARAINSREETIDSVGLYYRGACLNSGWDMRRCSQLVQQVIGLVIYNMTHGLPQPR